MAITLAQSVTTPANVTTGGTIQPADVSTLYTALGNFTASELLFGLVLAQSAVDDTEYTVNAGSARDWTITPPTGATAPTRENTILGVFPFAWSGAAAAPTIQIRINGTDITTAANLQFSNVATGQGLMLVLIAGHDATYARCALALAMESNAAGTLKASLATTDLPNAAVTTVGVSVGGTGTTMTFRRVRFWRLN